MLKLCIARHRNPSQSYGASPDMGLHTGVKLQLHLKIILFDLDINNNTANIHSLWLLVELSN